MKKLALSFAAIWIAGCLLGKDDHKKKDPKFNEFIISGPLTELPHPDAGPTIDQWFLHIDSLYPDREDLYSCTGNGYLGNADVMDYTNQWMSQMNITSSVPFTAPKDTVVARNFTHWRLNVTCPDSVPVPQ